MSAFTMTSAKAFAAPKLGRSTARRGPVVVRAEKVSHGKGGEEGGATFNNDAFGMVAKNANYMLFATAVTKVRPMIPTAIHDAIDPARETRARRPGARSDDPPSSTPHVESREICGSRDVRFSRKRVPLGRARRARRRRSTRRAVVRRAVSRSLESRWRRETRRHRRTGLVRSTYRAMRRLFSHATRWLDPKWMSSALQSSNDC